MIRFLYQHGSEITTWLLTEGDNLIYTAAANLAFQKHHMKRNIRLMPSPAENRSRLHNILQDFQALHKEIWLCLSLFSELTV